ncbi:fatty acid desaturase [Microvirga sp. SRT01]|uniref:Fatty acid desaturase n=2 Tax=Sphingomonas longa TaxID=2778730 RepID=A0ABS2D3Q4_9SPHN|nr:MULTISPECIES: fatty acid desaturase [Alphaproteobacteria]MBM6575557.1 fatty acid desaturase [Sphingomonas sp. BT552]MBR7708605.1 fatty acid desaturase [Microvirga sp. SRT01]
MTSMTLDRAATAPVAGTTRIADDKAMLRAAADLTRELSQPKPAIYWADLVASAMVGYGALAVAVTASSTAVVVLAGIVAMLGLYRAMSFIHEVSHMKHGSVPHFRLGWNLLVGIPMLIPSFMYEGVHNLHHAKTRYGTVEDPEYLPLALMKPWTLPLFIVVSALAPVALLFRYAILSPLSVVVPSLRRAIVERYSALAINPQFRRRAPEGAAAIYWNRIEAAASIWAIALVAMVATGVIPLRAFGIAMLIASAVAVINQVRTLVAHLWENEGEPMSVTAQYLDTVNVPPPSLLPALWAPVGLRYHALHHLLPSVPYHALGEAHRRLTAILEAESPYHEASYPGLPGLVWKIGRSTMGRR